MTWRGSTDTKDRIFAALVYLMPLYYSYGFRGSVLDSIPGFLYEFIKIILIPWKIVTSVPFGSLILFFVLFLAVVRNYRISHFIRFNTMQALLLCLALILVGMGFNILGLGIFLNPIVFIIALAVCLYSIIQSAQGSYPDIPGISQNVYNQIP